MSISFKYNPDRNNQSLGRAVSTCNYFIFAEWSVRCKYLKSDWRLFHSTYVPDLPVCRWSQGSLVCLSLQSSLPVVMIYPVVSGDFVFPFQRENGTAYTAQRCCSKISSDSFITYSSHFEPVYSQWKPKKLFWKNRKKQKNLYFIAVCVGVIKLYEASSPFFNLS